MEKAETEAKAVKQRKAMNLFMMAVVVLVQVYSRYDGFCMGIDAFGVARDCATRLDKSKQTK